MKRAAATRTMLLAGRIGPNLHIPRQFRRSAQENRLGNRVVNYDTGVTFAIIFHLKPVYSEREG